MGLNLGLGRGFSMAEGESAPPPFKQAPFPNGEPPTSPSDYMEDWLAANLARYVPKADSGWREDAPSKDPAWEDQRLLRKYQRNNSAFSGEWSYAFNAGMTGQPRPLSRGTWVDEVSAALYQYGRSYAYHMKIKR